MFNCRRKSNGLCLSIFIVAAICSLSVSVKAQSETIDSTVVTDTNLVVAAPPTSVIASEYKYDDAEALELSWVPSIDDQLVDGLVLAYRVYRATNGGELEMIEELTPGNNNFTDHDLSGDSSYSYVVAAVTVSGEYSSNATAAISPEREWLNYEKKWLFLIALFITSAIMYFIRTARKKKLFVRKIAGLEAIDDAVGRATEMGRSILFIPGIQDMDDVQTLAGLTILGRIAGTIAEYDTKLFMPVSRSLVMTAARETIKASFQTAGRPDKYHDDIVTYVTDEQFGYVAHVDGIMVREKPATVFLLGAFFAESLILAETGNSIGAIQIAGTARPAQLPFFIAACDFTLIGEELFAASAYLSDEPRALGSLKGQDVGKALAMFVILIGVLATTIASAWHVEAMQTVVDTLSSVFSTK